MSNKKIKISINTSENPAIPSKLSNTTIAETTIDISEMDAEALDAYLSKDYGNELYLRGYAVHFDIESLAKDFRSQVTDIVITSV
jgi:uncharacterized protein (DUF2164 family)